MRETILAYLMQNEAATVDVMAQDMGASPRLIQDTLHVMDDDGDVLMKSGIYRISECARLRMKARPA